MSMSQRKRERERGGGGRERERENVQNACTWQLFYSNCLHWPNFCRDWLLRKSLVAVSPSVNSECKTRFHTKWSRPEKEMALLRTSKAVLNYCSRYYDFCNKAEEESLLWQNKNKDEFSSYY